MPGVARRPGGCWVVQASSQRFRNVFNLDVLFSKNPTESRATTTQLCHKETFNQHEKKSPKLCNVAQNVI
jgi:hypothetical protein